jgi:hypothetical protein
MTGQRFRYLPFMSDHSLTDAYGYAHVLLGHLPESAGKPDDAV